MTVDLGAIFGQVTPAVESLITTGGTTLQIRRSTGGRGAGETDPQTLTYTADEPTVVHASVPAFLAPLVAGAGALDQAATPVTLPAYLVLLLPAVEDLREQDELEVMTCLDQRLVGRILDVTTILDNSSGLVRLAHANPRTLGPGAT